MFAVWMLVKRIPATNTRAATSGRQFVSRTNGRILFAIDVWMCGKRLFLRTTFALACLYAARAHNDDLYVLNASQSTAKKLFRRIFSCFLGSFVRLAFRILFASVPQKNDTPSIE